MPKLTSTRRRSNGFTLTEMVVVGGLMSCLVLLMSGAWFGLGRPSADALVRCRLAQEANLAAASLARDFRGSLPDETGGVKECGRLVGQLVVDGSQLWLCFDGEPLNDTADWALPDTEIVYEMAENRLIRSNQKTNTTFSVADNLVGMRVTEQFDVITIELDFSYRDLDRTYTFVANTQ